MGKEQNYKLIDGVFTSEAADQVLTELINYKIDYHNREDFSNHIRFNQEIEQSKVRIEQLTKTKEEIKKLMVFAKENNKKLIINGNISIVIED